MGLDITLYRDDRSDEPPAGWETGSNDITDRIVILVDDVLFHGPYHLQSRRESIWRPGASSSPCCGSRAPRVSHETMAERADAEN
jgi:hypothetical protein